MSASSDKSLFPLPFALLIGPQRAGTTWVDRYLRSRGDICLPEEVKEVFFFDRNYDRGADFYKSHFNITDQHALAMEITATSFDHPYAPQRVYDLCGPDIKLICPLRYPIVRSYSLYLHYLRYGIVRGSLEEAIKQEPQILSSSHYSEHLKRWFDVFGKDNITVLFQEELEKNQKQFVTNLCDGLGIEFIPPVQAVQGRYNITTFSKFGPLAAITQKTADVLRYFKMYWVINLGKAIGLKRLIFGKECPDAKRGGIPEDDYELLMDHLYGEVTKLERLLGHKIELWEDMIPDSKS